MRASLLAGLSVCVAITCCSAHSQAPATAGAFQMHIEGINISRIANAPFRANVIVRWDEPLVGGGTVSKMYYTMVARDSQGRVRRETRSFIQADSSDEPPLRTFTVTDPISNTSTICTEATLTCSRGVFRRRVDFVDDTGNGLPAGNNGTRVSLGHQTMNGLTVVGTRETSSGTAGSGGNRRVAITSTEVWYSSDLHVDLNVTRNNPQFGTVTLAVTDLARGELDASWFAVPSGYSLKNPETLQRAFLHPYTALRVLVSLPLDTAICCPHSTQLPSARSAWLQS